MLSLVICAYKESPYLEECIISLLNQNVKCSVSISTSTPNEGIKKLAKKYKLPLHINKHSNGYYDDFLFAYYTTKTKFVTLCHQDDIYLPNFTSEVIKKIKSIKKPIIIFSNYYDLKKSTTVKNSNLLLIKRILNFPLRFKTLQKSKIIRTRVLSLGNSICSPTVTFNKDFVTEPVLKCPFPTSHDWYTWINLAKITGSFVYISKPLLLRRINELSETTTVIANNTKKKSDYEIFKMLWPEWIAKRIARIYCKSELNNVLDGNKNILIIDDVFPLKNSAFRYQEFVSILDNIPDCEVFSTFESLRLSNNYSYNKVIKDFINNNPKFSKNISTKLPENTNQYKLLYGLFLHNTYKYILPIAEKYKIPFIFTLYPGGRLSLNDKKSDKMLKKVLGSKYLIKVIVTQKIVNDYLLEKKFCTEDKIEYLFGGIVLNDKLSKKDTKKVFYGFNKKELDICFVAYKYSKNGADKGYDIFIEVAKKMQKQPNIRFHVVGNFDKDTINLGDLKNVTFYGIKTQEWFDEFYGKMDIIISPNIYGKLRKGSFDGFPTTCVIEASLNQVAIFCTDFLKMNDNYYDEDSEIVIINRDVDKICEKITFFYNNPKKLQELAINGSKKTKYLFGYEAQISRRLNILKENLNNKECTVKKNRVLNFIINLKAKSSYLLNIIYGFIKKKVG